MEATVGRLRDEHGRFIRADGGLSTTDGPPRADATVQNTLSFSGVRGVDIAASYVVAPRELLDPQEQETITRQIAMAHRLCAQVAADTTRAGWCADTATERDVGAATDERLGVRARFMEAAYSARVYGSALIVMVPPGSGSLLTPLRPGEPIAALQVFDGPEIFPDTWDTNLTSPTFRDPLTWMVTPFAVGPVNSFRVHASRVLYLWGARMTRRMRMSTPNLRFLDMSVLELYREALIRREALDLAAVAAAESLDVMVFKTPGMIAKLATSTDGAAALRARLATFVQQASRVGMGAVDSEEEVQRLPLTISGYDALDQTSRRALSAVEGIPQVQLFGDTPSGLNTDNESGARQYESFVAAYQEDHFTAQLRHLYAADLGIPDGDVSIRYNPIRPMTLGEVADVELKLAQRDALLAQASLVDPSEVRGRLRADETTARYALSEDDDMAAALMGEERAVPEGEDDAGPPESSDSDEAITEDDGMDEGEE